MSTTDIPIWGAIIWGKKMKFSFSYGKKIFQTLPDVDSVSEKGGQEGCNAQEAPARSRRSDEERRRRCRQNQAQ